MSLTIDCGEGKHDICSGTGDRPYLIPQAAGTKFECACSCHSKKDAPPQHHYEPYATNEFGEGIAP